MQLHRTLFAATLSLAFAACSSTDERFADIVTESEAAPGMSLTGKTTYAWGGALAAVRDPEMKWTVPDLDVGAEIVYLANQELRSRGFSEVAVSPELIAMYGVGVDMMAVDLIEDVENETAHFEDVPQGGLFVVLLDARTSEILWVGAASGKIQDNPSIELVKDRLAHGVEKMFAELPEG
ncbi:MAG: DUF4136 domain-containing protein [Planctomycetota bacterium]